jgi:HNH endonuclease
MREDKRQGELALEEPAPPAIAQRLTPVVTRSRNLPTVKEYGEYLPYLRQDFWFSCAYCTMTESEARAVRFTIDHYDPAIEKPELKNEYSNLMYSCDQCNSLKGDRSPPQTEREKGWRFFRVDEDVRSEHFQLVGVRVRGTTNVGRYTVDAIDLNRESLRRIRQLRQRLIDNEGFVGEGITALASFPIDRLGPQVRGQALAAINKALELAEKVYDDFDQLLIEFAKSNLLTDGDSEEDIQRNKERLARLKNLEGISPGSWRGRSRKKKRH